MMWHQLFKNKKVGMLLWILIGEQVLLHLILIPLDYLLSARFCPVKVAKHPYQGKTLTGQGLAEIYWTSGIRIIVSRVRDAFAREISILVPAWVCCWSDLDIVSFVPLNRCSHKRTYGCKIVPDRCDGFFLLYHCGAEFWDGCVCVQYQSHYTWYRVGGCDSFSFGE